MNEELVGVDLTRFANKLFISFPRLSVVLTQTCFIWKVTSIPIRANNILLKGLNWEGYEISDCFMILTYLYSIIQQQTLNGRILRKFHPQNAFWVSFSKNKPIFLPQAPAFQRTVPNLRHIIIYVSLSTLC